MRLGRAAAYGMLALMTLARRDGDSPPRRARHNGNGTNGKSSVAAAHEIARATGVPVEYLRKIMQRLSRARIVRSERGRAGGFSLRVPAHRITLLQVVEAIEGPIDEVAIFDDPLLRRSHDPLHRHLKRWRDTATLRLREMLSETTLNDIVEQSRERKART
jgi:Rrf2 family protein